MRFLLSPLFCDCSSSNESEFMAATDVAVHPERIEEVSREISHALAEDLSGLRLVNTRTRLLSLNARIEAARAGAAGAAFGIVAENVMELAKTMDASFRSLETRTGPLLNELGQLGNRLASDVRGRRLSDLAATHIDLVDRNLYERSCDVRWWATEGALVRALETHDAGDFLRASVRMGKILDSYTVYFDLVLCDLQGRVVANGRPGQYQSRDADMSRQEWFRTAIATRSGGDFGFEGVHASSLAGGERVLVYSTAVRAGGEDHGTAIGVIGVVFRWDALGQAIVESAHLPPNEVGRTLVAIVGPQGRVLAGAGRKELGSDASWAEWLARDASPRYHFQTSHRGRRLIVAIARSQGYETYSTGWIGAIIQELPGE